jgi:hypothetical protein
MRTRTARLLTLLVATAPAPVLPAREPMPLPALEVRTLDGPASRAVVLPGLAGDASAPGASGRWLLVLVDSRSAPSRAVLAALAHPGEPPAASSMVVLVEGSTEEARALRGALEGLSGAQWYADPGRRVAPSLRVRSLPTVIGLDGRQVEWSAQGTLADPAKLRSLVRSWAIAP